MEPPPIEAIPDLNSTAGSAEPSHPHASAARVGPESDSGAWRGELAAKLNRYRSRRKAPPPRYPSLKLPFGAIDHSPAHYSPESSSFPAFDSTSNHALALDGILQQPAPPSELDLSPHEQAPTPPPHRSFSSQPSSPQLGAKIIEFPRFAWAPPPLPADQLAGPVGEQLRILEVPEVAPPPPALGGITIEPVPAAEPERRPGIDLPIQSSPLGRRLLASFVDGLVIATASALFGFVFWKIAAVRPPQLQLFGLAAGIPLSLWAAYQYLLTVYSGSTPGLRVVGLELARFDGTSTTRSLRRWRILASYLSAVSLGMGYAWVCLDEDALCWHDRITRTYLAPRKKTDARDRS